MKVVCTNGLKTVMLELAPAFERTTASRISITWGATQSLVEDIESGLAADVAILTAEAIDALIARGRVAAGSRIDLARSGIGLAVRSGASKPDIGSPDALRQALLAARSVAHSKAGMSGLYFPTVLARLGIAETMQSKIVLPEAGTPVGELVASGDAEIGVQQISELLPVAGIEILGPLPEALQKVTTFSAGLIAAAGEPERARALLKFIAAESRPLLSARGLDPPG